MINNGSFLSFTKYFISNVERFAFMRRTCLRTLWHINHVMRDNGSHRSLMCLFNVEILVFKWTCLNYTRLMNGSARDGSPRSVWRTRFFTKRINIDLLRTGRSSFKCTHWSRHAWYRVAPISHELDLALVGSIGNFEIAAQLLIVEHVLNLILFSIRDSKRSLAKADVTSILFRNKTSPVFILTTFRKISWKCFLKDNRIRSSLIEC